MTPEPRKYLQLEQLMLDAESVDEAAADALRDVMDAVWYGLTPEDRRFLNERRVGGPIRVLECVHLAVSQTALQPPVRAVPRPYDGSPVLRWRRGAA